MKVSQLLLNLGQRPNAHVVMFTSIGASVEVLLHILAPIAFGSAEFGTRSDFIDVGARGMPNLRSGLRIWPDSALFRIIGPAE